MTKSTILIIFISIVLISCNKNEKQSETNNSKNYMTDNNFKKIINEIVTSDTFENPKNWETRGLNPSNRKVITLLRKSTNNFLGELEKIYYSNESSEIKLKQISNMVDELPWDELDTEEKEFLADTLSPAIKAAGFNPSLIF